MTDYTNDRWHVDGEVVTHDDFPGMRWLFLNEIDADFWSRRRTQIADSHAARAWLAAQPMPAIKVGTRIEATLRGGAVVTGKVTGVTECGDWTMVHIGGGVTCYADVNPKYRGEGDITDWHEVTA